MGREKRKQGRERTALHLALGEDFALRGIDEQGEYPAFPVDDSDVIIGGVFINEPHIDFSRKPVSVRHRIERFAFRCLYFVQDIPRGKGFFRADGGCGQLCRGLVERHGKDDFGRGGKV